MAPTRKLETSFPTFGGHIGVKGELLKLMIDYTCKTDGKFRSGCIGTLADFDRKTHLENMKDVINPNYLEQINKNYLFERKIHYLECNHMAPIERLGR